MKMAPEILTTGEVSRLIGLSPRTVSKFIDQGALNGFRIPGSNDRRIPLKDLVEFLRKNNMDSVLDRVLRIKGILVLGPQSLVDELKKLRCNASMVKSEFALGKELSMGFPPAVVIDSAEVGPTRACEIAKEVVASLVKNVWLITPEDNNGLVLPGGVLPIRSPFSASGVALELRDVLYH